MTSHEWSDAFSVGISQLDEDHQRIIALLCQLQGAKAEKQPAEGPLAPHSDDPLHQTTARSNLNLTFPCD